MLWKAKADEPAWAQWDAPFGRGRPGLAHRVLGHEHEVPGRDLRPPLRRRRPRLSRTTRTRSRRASAAPGRPFVRHWMHVEHLLVENETMSKSKGNFFTIPDLLERGPSARRHPLPARVGPLPQAAQLHLGGPGPRHGGPRADPRPRAAAGRGRARGSGGAAEAAVACEARAEFDAALADDLNTPEALAAVHDLVTAGQRAAGRGRPDPRRRPPARHGRARSRWTACSACSCPGARTS